MTVDGLVVASKNAGKIAEMEPLVVSLGLASRVVTGLDWPDVDETGDTLAENAILKARTVARATGLPALADDTGLEVAALGGAPGVHTARYAGENATFADNIAKMLTELAGVSDRSARFVTVVTLAHPDGTMTSAEGVVEGRIAEAERGDGGFGYDPIFEIDGVTFAEMGEEAKSRISHRSRALVALAEKLKVN